VNFTHCVAAPLLAEPQTTAIQNTRETEISNAIIACLAAIHARQSSWGDRPTCEFNMPLQTIGHILSDSNKCTNYLTHVLLLHPEFPEVAGSRTPHWFFLVSHFRRLCNIFRESFSSEFLDSHDPWASASEKSGWPNWVDTVSRVGQQSANNRPFECGCERQPLCDERTFVKTR